MYITQCYYSEAGEEGSWHDLNKWHDLSDAKKDLKECLKMYKKCKHYKWRIIERTVIHKVTEKVIK